jgi:hypothetical protein
MGKLYTRLKDTHTDYITGIDAGDILEIGMERGEGSTKYFMHLADKRKVDYHGVDIEPKEIKKQSNATVTQSTGEQYLESLLASNTKTKFSLVYLDNHDWDYAASANTNKKLRIQQEAVYKKYDIELNNVNSQKAHLLQAILLTDLLTANATIMCDDTWYDKNYQTYMGKCSSAIPYLLSIGFKIAHAEGYQNEPASCVIMTRRQND